jgi:predicted amidophosphoribosyltransferase
MSYEFSNMEWRDDNTLSLFPYYPIRSGKKNEMTGQILNFKENQFLVVEKFKEYARQAMEYEEEEFREVADSWYILSAPRSTAREPNKPCESVSEYLALTCPWIYYIPGALVRTQTVPSSARAYSEGRQRNSQFIHENTIVYAGPPLQPSYGIIFVDDVLTTSSTFHACCGILRKSTQCEHIFGLFMGRTQYI